MSEFWAAVAGAAVGGAGTFIASWWQTRRVFVHERAMSLEAAAEERRAARHAISSAAAHQLLDTVGDVVADLDRHIPGSQRFHEALDALRSRVRADLVGRAPVIGEPLSTTWRTLDGQLYELATTHLATDAYGNALAEGPIPDGMWSAAQQRQAVRDALSAAMHAQTALVLLIDHPEREFTLTDVIDRMQRPER